ncbi:glycosyltransferase family 2 protein [uncultured Tateyamaria sp.]|uniref:glycosyltransferase family 2 protein n=1 Tax=uncultured Tateyamaria sp. TaxID=455651 RepID=UPI00260F4150|nr:glycosyltransferase family 2 protein [uncultured Tateyamaria sp.]
MNFIREWNRARKYRKRIRRCRSEIATRSVIGDPHQLTTPLVVSLTSYPPRYPELALTLRCLLQQTVKADRTVLWIAEKDIAALPAEVRALEKDGLEIATCPDMRSYKKLMPLLTEMPEATIVTADDDVHYGPDWLASILDVHMDLGLKVVCGRGHRMALTPEGFPDTYDKWDQNAPGGREPSGLIFPTGVGGILYAPGALAPIATNWELAQQLCPTADDVWFYWMHRLTGGRAAMTGERRRVLEWVKDPTGGLLTVNSAGGNDNQIAAMIDHFGWPGP